MTYLFGLDGYDWRWRSYLQDRGYHVAPLFSRHATSGPAWNTIMSGLSWETHRHAGQPNRLGEPLHSNPPPYIWDHLLARGKESVVVNVPFIWPPSPIRLHVCGYPAPHKFYTFPRSAALRWSHDELDSIGYDYIGNKQTWPKLAGEERWEKARQSGWGMAKKLTLELEKGYPDLCVFSRQTLDRLSHLARPLLKARLGEVVGALLDIMESIPRPEDSWCFVVSDHGLELESGGNSHGKQIPATQLGIFAYRGPGMSPWPEGVKVQQEDVLPTVLWTLDTTPAFPIEGRARVNIGAARDQAEMRNKLEALGYV